MNNDWWHVRSRVSIIQYKANPNYQDSSGHTALFYAAQNGNLDIIRLLLQYGASVNIRSRLGKTALFFATKHGQLEAVQALIKAGADVNIKDESGWENFALMVAVENRYLNIVKILLQNGAKTHMEIHP